MRQYTEAPKHRSTAPLTPAGGGCRVLAAALLALLMLAASCPTAASPAAAPASVVLAAAAPAYYSLQASADRKQWVAVFADARELTLKLARGPLPAPEAGVSSVITIDRVDVPPGINPYLGRHAYLQHAGVEHLFYSDQELADSRVTKWVHRELASDTPWTVDLLPEAILPLAVLPAAAQPPAGPRFTLYGLVDAPGAERDGATVVAYDLDPGAVTDPTVTAVGGRRAVMTGVAPAPANGAAGPAVSGHACAGRSGFTAADGTGLLVVESERSLSDTEDGATDVQASARWPASPGQEPQGPRRIALPRREAATPGPAALGCGPQGTLVVYTRSDQRALSTGSGAPLQAREVVAVNVGAGGDAGAEIKVTLARAVGVLAVFPEPPLGDSERPALTVLFSELALDDAGASEYRLSLVTPTEDASYAKRVLVRGAQPVQDLRALRAGSDLLVAFRRARELRLLRARLANRVAVEPQSGGSW